jgi:hypothetical protein
MAASLQACGVVFPFAMPTSICRSIVTICSGLHLWMGMTCFSSKWILSHSTWYKNRRSRQGQLTQSGVAVEKVHFSQNSRNLRDRKCLGEPRKSFVGLPNAKFFRPFSGERVFQQPQAISLIEGF